VTELEREHRMLAKESLVLDGDIEGAKQERDLAFEGWRLGDLEAHVRADEDQRGAETERQASTPRP